MVQNSVAVTHYLDAPALSASASDTTSSVRAISTPQFYWHRDTSSFSSSSSSPSSAHEEVPQGVFRISARDQRRICGSSVERVDSEAEEGVSVWPVSGIAIRNQTSSSASSSADVTLVVVASIVCKHPAAPRPPRGSPSSGSSPLVQNATISRKDDAEDKNQDADNLGFRETTDAVFLVRNPHALPSQWTYTYALVPNVAPFLDREAEKDGPERRWRRPRLKW